MSNKSHATYRFARLRIDPNPDDANCTLLEVGNLTSSLAPNWENIPETLLLNSCIGFILFILFLVMVQLARDKGRREDDMSQGLISFLYGYRDPDRWYVIPRFEFLRRSERHHRHDLDYSNIYVPPKMPLTNPLEQSSFHTPSILTAEQMKASYLSKKLNRFFDLFFQVTDADLIYSKGIDAYEYLLFQRHLILVMVVTNVFCLGIILPVHWFTEESYPRPFATSFQSTTIKNMSSGSTYYWVHIISSLCIAVLTLVIMNSYRESTITKNEAQLSRRTLLIGNIPADQRNRPKLTKIINDYFVGSTVEAIQFVYDTSLLVRYQMQLDATIVAKDYCLYQKRRYNNEIMVKQTDVNEDQYCNGNCRLCSFFYVCCCYWPMETAQPGREFYAQREQYYRNKIKDTCEKMVSEPSEYAFVTFKSYKEARRVMKELAQMKTEILSDYRSVSLLKRRKPRSKSLESIGGIGGSSSAGERASKGVVQGSKYLITSGRTPSDPLDPNNDPHIRSIRSPITGSINAKLLGDMAATKKDGTATDVSGADADSSSVKSIIESSPIAWSVRYAPHPDNVEYYDLLNMATTSKFTIALLHGLMIVIFIFFTTPNVLMSVIERWSILRPERARQLTGFEGMFINYLSVLLQLLTSALLPSLITLISKQIPYEDSTSKNLAIMWRVYSFLILMVVVMPSIGMTSAQGFISSTEKFNPKCLFPTDNGAYFINYVLSAIFLSTILELIKPTDIVYYYFILWTGRSSADFEGGRQYIEREFSVSMQHTSVLLVFAVVMTYSISCPLIAPAGLLYMIIKHAVDHYHLFYIYFTKKVDRAMQNTIQIFVRVALIMMLLQTAVAININTGSTSFFSVMSQVIFWVTILVLLFNCFFDCTAQAIGTSTRSPYQREFCACYYLPRVIGDLMRANAVPADCISRKV